MQLTRDQLEDLVVALVERQFGHGLVERHQIIEAVEQEVRKTGVWEATDDADSQSTDPKSLGRAKIDYAISALKTEGRLENPSRKQWRVPPPLRPDDQGGLRVGRSRIRFDLVVEQYENGMTPEDMVRAYNSLDLADVYGVIGYYLRHRDQVRADLKRRGEEAAALRAKIEAERPRLSREELLRRRRAEEKADASAGQ